MSQAPSAGAGAGWCEGSVRHLMPRGSRDGARINNQPQVARRGREEGAAAALVDGGAAAATGTGLVGCLSLSLSGRGLRVGPLSPVAALLLRAAPGAGLGLVAEREGCRRRLCSVRLVREEARGRSNNEKWARPNKLDYFGFVMREQLFFV